MEKKIGKNTKAINPKQIVKIELPLEL